MQLTVCENLAMNWFAEPLHCRRIRWNMSGTLFFFTKRAEIPSKLNYNRNRKLNQNSMIEWPKNSKLIA